MSDLIRGGQVTIHKIRMLMQVSKILTRLSLILILVSIFYNYAINISASEWMIGAAWVKKDMVISFNENHPIKYKTRFGYEKTVKAKDLEKDPYVCKVIDKFEVTLYKGLVTSGIMLFIVVGGVILFFWLRGKALKKTKKLRGAFLITPTTLKRKIRKHNNLFLKSLSEHIPIEVAGFAYPVTGRVDKIYEIESKPLFEEAEDNESTESYEENDKDEEKLLKNIIEEELVLKSASCTAGEQSHTLVIGSTGAGKSRIIEVILHQLRQRRKKAIIIDIKGDFIQNFYRPEMNDVILNPLDKRGRNWSIFNETDALKGFSTIAKSLLPNNSRDPIWVDAARGVLSEMAMLHYNEKPSLSELADKILKTDLPTLTKLLEKTASNKVINEEIEKAALSVLMVLSTYLRPLKLYRSNKDCFSITDWVKDDKQNNFLFISSCEDVKEDINPLVSAQVDIAIRALRSLKQKSKIPKVWFILDELPYFEQPIPSLAGGLATARSFGGCFVLGTQDMSALAKIYSDKAAQSIANNCRTKIFMNVEGNETAKWCSDALGIGEIEEWHEGISYGSHEMRDGIQVNRTRTIRQTALPSEFMLLKLGEGYIKFPGFEPTKFKFKSCDFKAVANSFEENDELLKLLKKEVEEGEKRRLELEAKLGAITAQKEPIEDLVIKAPVQEGKLKKTMKTKSKQSELNLALKKEVKKAIELNAEDEW
ncbi:type IV secretion system DNA-binding domain-containing protein [Holosporaceae bacterium 'Namur']|nr:type IV secretion system DNA-binding domain-containing protein [Holosporaceae bacterium 'Namur']